MKKERLKSALHASIQAEKMLLTIIGNIDEQLKETEDALDRRRILYDRIVSHTTIAHPKSMRDMAGGLYRIFADKVPPDILQFEELPQKEQDLWMDRLLTILN